MHEVEKVAMLNVDYPSVIAAARSGLSDGLPAVSDAGLMCPRFVRGTEPGGHWDGLFGFEGSELRRHAKATGNKMLDHLANFHCNKFAQWNSRRPHKYQSETFAEFLARGGKPMVLSLVRGTRRFVEVEEIAA